MPIPVKIARKLRHRVSNFGVVQSVPVSNETPAVSNARQERPANQRGDRTLISEPFDLRCPSTGTVDAEDAPRNRHRLLLCHVGSRRTGLHVWMAVYESLDVVRVVGNTELLRRVFRHIPQRQESTVDYAANSFRWEAFPCVLSNLVFKFGVTADGFFCFVDIELHLSHPSDSWKEPSRQRAVTKSSRTTAQSLSATILRWIVYGVVQFVEVRPFRPALDAV